MVKPCAERLPSSTARTKAPMALSLAILLVLLGVYPQPILDTSAATMQGVQSWLDTAFTQLASAR